MDGSFGGGPAIGGPPTRALVVPKSPNQYLKRLNSALRERGVEIRESPFAYVKWPRSFAGFLARSLRGNDLWHLHWIVFDQIALAKWQLRRRVPKLWTVHNFTPHVPLSRNDLALARLHLEEVDVVVWHSRRTIIETKRHLEDAGYGPSWPAHDIVIPHMNFNDAWPNTVTEDAARTRLGLDSSTFVVGHYGPTLPYKGTAMFLRAAARFPSNEYRFLVFGECRDPGLRDQVLEAARRLPNLTAHLEFIPDSELQYWFNACDVVVQPYTKVTTSGTLYFPIAFKRPVIATPLGNIPDVIEHRVTGWLVTDLEDLCAAIEDARRDPIATRAIGERAREFVDRTASIGQVADAYLSAYDRAVS